MHTVDSWQAAHWLRVLIGVAEELQHAVGIPEVAQILVRSALRLGFERARLWLLAEDESTLVLVAQAGNSALGQERTISFPAVASRYIQLVLASDEALVFHAEEHGPSYLSRTLSADGHGPPVGSWVGIPLHADGTPRGALMLDNAAQARTLGPEQQDLIRLFGRQAGAGLERARKSFERLWLQQLNAIFEALQHELRIADIARVLVAAAQSLGFERARLYTYDAAADALVGLAEIGNDALANFTGLHIPLSATAYGRLMLGEREPRYFQGLDAGPTYLTTAYTTQGYAPPVGEWVIVPLYGEVRFHGVLALDNVRRARWFYPGERDLLKLLGRQAVAALERGRAYEEELHERDTRRWIELLNAVADEAQSCVRLVEVGTAIVQGSLRLGFRRARLWCYNRVGQPSMIGIAQAGNSGLEQFPGFIDSTMDAAPWRNVHATRNPIVHTDSSRRSRQLDVEFAAAGFVPPASGWVELPLWAGEELWGLLVLDADEAPIAVSPAQLSHLALFARQAAAALERARLYERDRWLHQITEIVNRIQEQADPHAVAREIISGARQLGFARARLWHFEAESDELVGVAQAGNRGLGNFQGYRVGRSAYLQRILDTRATQIFRDRQAGPSALDESFAQSGFVPPQGAWADIPLWPDNDTCWGLLTLDTPEPALILREEHQDLLDLYGHQVVIALERALRQQHDRHMLLVVQQLSEGLVGLVEEAVAPDDRDDLLLWQLLLAAISARFGLGFRAAMLLLVGADNVARGGLRLTQAHTEPAHSILEYLHWLRSAHDRPALLAQARVELSVELPAELYQQLLTIGENGGVILNAATDALPARLALADCALLPIPRLSGRRGSETLRGLVVIDLGRASHSVFAGRSREQLHATLVQAYKLITLTASIAELRRERQSRDQLVQLTNQVMKDLSERPLRATLDSICKAICNATDASCTVIYPFKPNQHGEEVDREHIGSWGLRNKPATNTRNPGQSGIVRYILLHGELIVEAVAEASLDLAASYPLSQHHFIRAEGIAALIGVRVTEEEIGPAQGVLFINYRTPQRFSAFDREQALAFARLTAVAMRNARAGLRARAHEAPILSDVLEHALTIDVSERGARSEGLERPLVEALLSAAYKLVPLPELTVGLLFHQWASYDGGDGPRQARYKYSWGTGKQFSSHDPDPNYERGITSKAMREGVTQRVDDVQEPPWCDHFIEGAAKQTRSELDVPIAFEGVALLDGFKASAVFNLESPRPAAFTEAHAAAIERLAAVAALAFNNKRRLDYLYNILYALSSASSADLASAVQPIVDSIRGVCPDVATITIWCRDAVPRGYRLASPFGLRGGFPAERLAAYAASPVLTHVLEASQPIWEAVVEGGPLDDELQQAEGIVSAAALPLRAGGQKLGAMLVGFRRLRRFSPEERVLFESIAAIATTSIRDYEHLQERVREGERLRAALTLTERLGAALDVESAISIALEQLARLFTQAKLFVLTYQPEDRTLRFHPASRRFYPMSEAQEARWGRVALDESTLSGSLGLRSLRSGSTTWESLPDVHACARPYGPVFAETRAKCCVTMMSGSELLGVLGLESAEPGRFSTDDEVLIELFARQLAVAIDRTNQSAQLQYTTALAVRTGWAADIAHDINSESGLIRGNVDLLRSQLGADPQALEALAEIDDSVDLLSQTFALVKRESAQAPAPILLDPWIESLNLRRYFTTASIALVLDLDCAGVGVHLHAPTLERALAHLMRNAREAMPGGGTITVRTRHTQGQARIEVEDSGPGIREEQRGGLFNRHYSTKQRTGGLGLLFVRVMMESMGGMVRLLPYREDVGAVFVLILPANPSTTL